MADLPVTATSDGTSLCDVEEAVSEDAGVDMDTDDTADDDLQCECPSASSAKGEKEG
jgi:hypothetical protein